MFLSTLRLGAVTLALTTLLTGAAHANPAATASYTKRADVQAFINDMVKKDGVPREEVTRLLASAERKQPILDAMSRPAEHTMTWGKYRKIFITEDRIQRGVDFYHTHKATLKRAEKQYGIPAEVIVAIIGVETRYGQHKGTHRVVDALATLGFDYPPRAKFFREQLREFILLGREAGIDLNAATGSYAGAMGFPQFIPSSYRDFAVDFDADNKIDLINNPADAIGSVANYFRKHDWKTGQQVVLSARYNGTPEQARANKAFNASLKPAVKAGSLAAMGLSTKKAIPATEMVSPMRLEGSKGDQYWIGLNNFYVITRYNHSHLYAMAVHQLSQKIKDKI